MSATQGFAAMSPERRRRLVRTALIGLVVLVVFGWAMGKVFGGESSSAAMTTKPTTSSRLPSPAVSASPAASSAGPTARASSPSSDPRTVPSAGNGALQVLSVPGQDTTRTGKTLTFDVEAEGGLGVDTAAFAAKVREVLSDGRGWEPLDSVHFVALTPQQVAAGKAVDIKITLASPDLTDKLCAPLQTQGKVSCNHGGRAVINAMRWAGGVSYYSDLQLYRTYVINHEVGHSLWHPHENCPGPGQKAPIMQQQTLGLQGCVAWPYPQH